LVELSLIVDSEDLAFMDQTRKSLQKEQREGFDTLTQALIEKKKAKEALDKVNSQKTSSVGMKLQFKSFKKN
jgi:hypothetical protein